MTHPLKIPGTQHRRNAVVAATTTIPHRVVRSRFGLADVGGGAVLPLKGFGDDPLVVVDGEGRLLMASVRSLH